MYNIGLCFYGEARNWRHGAKNIDLFKKKLSKNLFNVDVYFHLWDNITYKYNLSTREYEQRFRNLIKKNENLDKIFVAESNLQHKELIKSYKPIDYKIKNKNVLDEYVDKFNPSNELMSCEEIKRAIKYSNAPCFSQFYSIWQSYIMIKDSEKYDLIILLKTDCAIKSTSITEDAVKYYCQQASKNQLLVHNIFLKPTRPPNCKVLISHGCMMGNYRNYNKLFHEFPKQPIGMGCGLEFNDRHTRTKGSSSVELANYMFNHTTLNKISPIGNTFEATYHLFPKIELKL